MEENVVNEKSFEIFRFLNSNLGGISGISSSLALYAQGSRGPEGIWKPSKDYPAGLRQVFIKS